MPGAGSLIPKRTEAVRLVQGKVRGGERIGCGGLGEPALCGARAFFGPLGAPRREVLW